MVPFLFLGNMSVFNMFRKKIACQPISALLLQEPEVLYWCSARGRYSEKSNFFFVEYFFKTS
ncbi:MAG: hypothetical protein D3923_10945 [Candidatus Electrothrix sp. AR3]|nr:hypothetical protein [Candidatus Electrothrix sp. AR3]